MIKSQQYDLLATPQGRPGIESGRTRRARPDEDPGSPLGIYAKNPSGTVKQAFSDSARQQGRAERFALKSVVGRLLPESRTSKCMRWQVPGQQTSIHLSTEHRRAFFSGLQVCASVWACPVCAAKISERRRVELVSAIATAKAMSLQVHLLTLTVPHGLGDDVRVVLARILEAWKKTTHGRAGQGIRAAFQIRGMIRALEVTHGKNGFHPHLHVLVFSAGSHSPQDFQSAFSPLWQKVCIAAGLSSPSDEHGCKVSDGSYAARYASKWGLESEMTKNHLKKGKSGSRSPWDFLRDVFEKRDSHEKSAALFRVYAAAFKGRRQLVWSVGLRDLLGLGVVATDEEIADQIQDEAVVLAQITPEEWSAILRTKSECLILEIAEKRPEKLAYALNAIREIFSPPLPDRVPHPWA
jgi:hypothetical protein